MSPFSFFLPYRVSVFVLLFDVQGRVFSFGVSRFSKVVSFFAVQPPVNPNLELVTIPLFSFEILRRSGNCGQVTVARVVWVTNKRKLPFADLSLCSLKFIRTFSL